MQLRTLSLTAVLLALAAVAPAFAQGGIRIFLPGRARRGRDGGQYWRGSRGRTGRPAH